MNSRDALSLEGFDTSPPDSGLFAPNEFDVAQGVEILISRLTNLSIKVSYRERDSRFVDLLLQASTSLSHQLATAAGRIWTNNTEIAKIPSFRLEL